MPDQLSDPRAMNIHACTTMHGSEEVIELRQGPKVVATANAGLDGLYKVAIKPLASSPGTAEEEVCMAAWGAEPMSERNLAHGTPHGMKVAKPDIWHSRFGHPGTTIFQRMIPLTHGHNLTASDVGKTYECVACIQGKLIKRPSSWILPTELPPPLHRIHGDVCGPINLPLGTFQYYFVLVDASGSHLEMSLFMTRNMVFPRILSMLLRYRNYFPNFPIKHLRLDNVKEFRSHAFRDFYIASGIDLTYSVAYEHLQNELAEGFVKKIQLVARPLLLYANFVSSIWGHAILDAVALLKLRPTLLNIQTLMNY